MKSQPSISLREWPLVQWIFVVKPLVLIVGFGWWLWGASMGLALGLLYGGFKVVEILIFKGVFEAIMREKLKCR